MRTIYYSIYQSPIGALLLGATDRGLAFVDFKSDRKPKPNEAWVHDPGKTEPYEDELSEYFAGKRREFSKPLDFQGTDFQKRCWNALLRIPYGKTCSYADIAREVGSPRGFRAVGMANHDNPIPIIVPCHRVITSDGKLGGYGGGLKLKEQLLQLEGARLPYGD